MELYETKGYAEKLLQLKADQSYTPLGGSIELLPLCNMHCKMCYVVQSKEEMNKQGRMLSCDEWLDIARQGCKEGLLFLLLTGGEPLLYPEFKRLYKGLSDMGIIMTINTNGTLINEEWADFFKDNGVRRINMTIYGKDNETYSRLCNNPKGFTQIMKAAHLLKERNVAFRFNCSVTPDNIDQLPDLYKIAQSFEVPISIATYMFPGARINKTAEQQYRLSAKDAGKQIIKSFQYGHPNDDIIAATKVTLNSLNNQPRLKDKEGFPCHAGYSGFWMTWKGEMMPCGMFQKPQISLLKYSFKECWDYIVNECKKLPQCNECIECDKQNVCQICPAMNYTETGRTDGCPKYVCDLTNAFIDEMNRILKQDHC
ncbi:MAG: radical SAM protein [Erysipelotrichaceae bacterium]|nr:radical SAM protein [Erysipelotrichaceae bacterium]